MKPHIVEFPRHPFPPFPQPQAPQQPHVQLPTVYVYERQRWEYQVVTKNVAEQPSPSGAALNALGKDGWELVGVVQVQAMGKRSMDGVLTAAFARQRSSTVDVCGD